MRVLRVQQNNSDKLVSSIYLKDAISSYLSTFIENFPNAIWKLWPLSRVFRLYREKLPQTVFGTGRLNSHKHVQV